ncbi:hypothetical protein [Arthrobacter sp. B3I4]|uniref:hypothetical protein n=1 Tax=Arthrobacter sp. B3I4 TaxID=3042267 RepID=UPI00278086F3|nr:hypothetical protein [Arthrobacter sp. B3I4]MDQ0757312.1 hypothetical protein [Arthrobacter sp. B3I4]
MASDFLFRTEDFRRDEVLEYYVKGVADDKVIDALLGRTPAVLEGSRGVGKSFLMRVAEQRLRQDFAVKRIMPVYVTFAVATLISNPTPEKFRAWMMSRIAASFLKSASEFGLALRVGSSLDRLANRDQSGVSVMERLAVDYENSWRNEGADPDLAEAPDPELFLEALQEFSEENNLTRTIILIDEAAHVFIPAQQREFFTLMRSLRSAYLAVKAAVYPGVTSFGEYFQPQHDATFVSVDRNVSDPEYREQLREIVFKQAPELISDIKRNGQVFDVLAYAATGNPRILLKTMQTMSKINTASAELIFRNYYREEIWSEHSLLADKYPGHEPLISWGRRFIEQEVLPALYARNLRNPGATSSYLWIHRDAPAAVKESLRLLCYSGILQEGTAGIKATRSEIGTRYILNLGCQFSLDSSPIKFGASIMDSLSLKRMIEYGAKHPFYGSLVEDESLAFSQPNASVQEQLGRSLNVLDLSDFMRTAMGSVGLRTIGDVLKADVGVLKAAPYIGPVRASRMHNAAHAAVYEYLSG